MQAGQVGQVGRVGKDTGQVDGPGACKQSATDWQPHWESHIYWLALALATSHIGPLLRDAGRAGQAGGADGTILTSQ